MRGSQAPMFLKSGLSGWATWPPNSMKTKSRMSASVKRLPQTKSLPALWPSRHFRRSCAIFFSQSAASGTVTMRFWDGGRPWL